VTAKFTEALDFIDRVRTIDRMDLLISEFQALVLRYGFTSYCVGNPTAPKLDVADRVWCATWPKDWASVWVQKNFAAIDPVVYQLLASKLPFRWTDLHGPPGTHGAEVMNAASEFNLRDGMGIPLYTRDRKRVGITIAGSEFALSEREQSCLHLAAIYFQARLEVLRTKGPSPKRKSSDELTVRELDCLAWIAAGKTDWEIAQILSISALTVNSHVRSILRKLNAMHRAQAVAKAIVGGMIAP
jgi:LuxR family transcriptional regulator, quorum-sensing system regulator BjaR1